MTADPLHRILEAVVAVLDERDTPYHVTGGLASSFYGEPRLTQDAILSKLLWARQGSAKSRNDVRGMLLDPKPLDERLLEKLAGMLGCAELLREVWLEAFGDAPDRGL